MYFPYRKLIHWLSTLAFIFGALAPTMTHAVSMPTNGSALAMEICMADGTKQVLDLNTEDAVTNASVECLYCLAQPLGLPSLLSNLQFASPSTHALIPNLFLESAKTLFAWVKLPSQGPPQNTRT